MIRPTAAALAFFSCAALAAESFHGAPPVAEKSPNAYTDSQSIQVGAAIFAGKCASCHGPRGEGSGNIPPLRQGPAQEASDGALFWFITRGSPDNGMPAWASLPPADRWRVISFIKALPKGGIAAAAAPYQPTALDAPPPVPPFTDFRFEAPGKSRHITLADLPPPYATEAASNGPRIIPRPADAWPKAPPGFKVELYKTGLVNPRIIRVAPNGDIFIAETAPGRIRLLRGITAEGNPAVESVFAEGLNRPFGIAFHPSGGDPKWVYVGDTDAVIRFPYHSGDLRASGPAETLAALPEGRGHFTRDLVFAPEDKTLFVSVGSASNVDDSPDEKERADILAFDPDGGNRRIFAYGIRNAVGLAIEPRTGALWASVNERDGLGDNLVPDYITHVEPGGFYGWPWWYMGGQQDPRHIGEHPELKDKVITPDVILNPHNASLEMTFYQGSQFPAEYRGDIFASEHGSWNRSIRVGYEVIRVPLHQTGKSSGEYEDFLTGFAVDNRAAWGRPVGVATAADGSLLVSDDGSGSIWRVSYTGK